MKRGFIYCAGMEKEAPKSWAIALTAQFAPMIKACLENLQKVEADYDKLNERWIRENGLDPKSYARCLPPFLFASYFKISLYRTSFYILDMFWIIRISAPF